MYSIIIRRFCSYCTSFWSEMIFTLSVSCEMNPINNCRREWVDRNAKQQSAAAISAVTIPIPSTFQMDRSSSNFKITTSIREAHSLLYSTQREHLRARTVIQTNQDLQTTYTFSVFLQQYVNTLHPLRRGRMSHLSCWQESNFICVSRFFVL